jgi:hypothetical protein
VGQFVQLLVPSPRGMYVYILAYNCMYHYNLIHTRFRQHAHIENLKTVAKLTNNKDIFMCIIRFHARAGYLQQYEILLKEINSHPGSEEVRPDQYEVETSALADRNLKF